MKNNLKKIMVIVNSFKNEFLIKYFARKFLRIIKKFFSFKKNTKFNNFFFLFFVLNY